MPNDAPQLLIASLKPALIGGMAQKLPVLVRIQAPDSPAEGKPERGPYHLALVIDRSGSMAGAPLREAVRCARHMIDRLAPTDRASLSVFDHRARTLVGAAPVGDRKALYRALSLIHGGGNTDLCGGWQAGADTLLPQAAEASMARVILLSDGNANAGELRDAESIAGRCGDAAAKGVTTSTYGLGHHFNEDLMTAMAERGRGNAYYGDTTADLLEPFAEEFDLISNLHSRNVRLALGAPEGIGITLVNDYPVEAREGFPLVCLPDIPFDAEAWAMVELDIPAARAVEGGLLLQASVTSVTPEGIPVAWPEATLHLPALSPAAWDTLTRDPLVTARLAEATAARWLLDAKTAAEHGDWATIERMIGEARQRFGDVPWVMEVLEELEELARQQDALRFRKESLYSSKKMSGRLSAKEELLALSAESSKASYLRRKKSQGKAQFDIDAPPPRPGDPANAPGRHPDDDAQP